jgi:hypothetical protein
MTPLMTECFYVEPPDIPAGMTVREYQRRRPRQRRRLRRYVKRS